MSFGYSVSDVLSVAALCWNVYKKCKDSSGEFKDASVELSCLHSVMKETEEVLSAQKLGSQQQARLQPLKDGIYDLLNEVERRLDKYESLGTQSKRTLDRMGWAMEGGVAELRQKLILQTTLLDAFNNSASHLRLERKLNQLICEVRAGKRQGSVISTQTFDSNDSDSWQELRRELEDIGISADVIREKRSFIVAWFEEAIAAGRLGEDELPGGQEELDPDSDEELDQPSDEEIGQSSEDFLEERPWQRPTVTVVKPIVNKRASSENQTTQVPGKRKSRLRLSYFLYVLRSDELLIEAARSGDLKKAEQLIEWGAKVNHCTGKWHPEGRTALHEAAIFGHESIVQLLLDKGANVEAENIYNATALHEAVFNWHESVVKLLLDKGADIEAKNKDNRTALHKATLQGHYAVVQLLLDKGANIKAKDKDNWTALHNATSLGRIAVVQLLLDNGADIEAKNRDDLTALHNATSQGHESIIQLLLDKGANIEAKNKDSWTALHYAAAGGYYAVVKLLLDNGANIEAKDKDNRTALHKATLKGHIAVVQLLLDNSTDTEAKDKDSWTALHYAVVGGYYAVVQLLLDNGANIKAKDKDNRTALHHAAARGRNFVVQLLLDRGADIEGKRYTYRDGSLSCSP